MSSYFEDIKIKMFAI